MGSEDHQGVVVIPSDEDLVILRLTGQWIPHLPKAHEKSVVLGGGRVVYPCPNPEETAGVLKEHTLEVARRAYQVGWKAAKAQIRTALFD